MGEALIRGMLRSEQTVASRVIVSNRNMSKLRKLKAHYGIRISRFNSMVVETSDIVILAVKPQDIKDTCTDIRSSLSRNQVVISIAAGVTIKKLKKLLGSKVKLIRVMPNTPALIDNGVSAIHASGTVSEKELQLAEEIFAAVGLTYRIPKEGDMDTITALSGTGPAYVYDIIHTLSEAGRKLGLHPVLARELTVHTLIGAAKMVMLTGEEPKELWKRVASKGGTTVAAFNVLHKYKFQAILERAVRAAAKRSKELGRL